jgi:tRNA (guanine37-N1)-methyltransferase
MSAENMLLRPPVNRAMRQLDRAFFKKKVPIAAARVSSNQHISLCRQELEKSHDLLRHEGIGTVQPDPDPASSGRKCLLLQPEIKQNGDY